MTESVATLLRRIHPDPWRSAVGFETTFQTFHDRILAAESTGEVTDCLGQWLERYQPCLFGRMAARMGQLSYCILSEDDLQRPDEEIQQKIQKGRLDWTQAGFEGRASGFILFFRSAAIAAAEPDENVRALALRLCSLYLLEDIAPDEIFLDELFLEIPVRPGSTWKWDAGVNYFCAQGDGRWWQDHRIPGGMAFSVNSVGHLVKSGVMTRGLREFSEVMGEEVEAYKLGPIDSLEKALEFAMRTIHGASNAVSGKATTLVPRPKDLSLMPIPTCPVELPRFLAGMNHCEYGGYYHTDYTVPSEYFNRSIARPAEQDQFELDFTYLFNPSSENPDAIRMGAGRRIRSRGRSRGLTHADRAAKARLGREVELPIAECERLRVALDRR